MEHANAPAGKPAISVVVPVYNSERYLGQCLDALLGQTLRDIEVIAVDDGSTDSSPDILARHAARDGRLRVVTQPNAGYGAAVNRGLDAASGDYVGIVESDDWPGPRMYATLHRVALRHDADLVKCDFYDVYGESGSIRRNLRGHAYNRVFDTADVPRAVLVAPSPWAALYRRSMLVENDVRCRETPGAAFQDTSFSLKALFSARRCVFVPDALLHYRRDNEAASTNSRGNAFAVCDEMAEARRYLLARPELADRFLPWLVLDKWRTYRWNRGRISPESHAAYDARVRSEFEQAVSEGEADLALFEPDELADMQRLVAGAPDPAAPGSPAAAAIARMRELRARLADASAVKVSIVMPVYDDAATLARAVRSCLAQTHRDIELIAVEDGSSDGSRELLAGLAAADGRLRVVSRGRNTGAHNARLAGVEHATGDIITFLDADDELVRTACAEMAEAFARVPVDIVHFGMRVRPEPGVPDEAVRDMAAWTTPFDGFLHGRAIVRAAFVEKRCSFGVCGKAFLAETAKRAFSELGECESAFGEDALEYFAIAARARSYRGLPKRRLYVYRLGAGHSGASGLAQADFQRTLSGRRAVDGMHAFAERAGLLESLGGACDAHRAGQLSVTLRSLASDVAEPDRVACMGQLLGLWPRDEVVSAACGLGTPVLELVGAALGSSPDLSAEQAYALGLADGKAAATAELEAGGTYRLGHALGAVPRKLLALKAR